MKKIFLTALIILLFSVGGFAQTNYLGANKLALPKTYLFPPLNTSMPIDVLVGYIYFDSLCRNSTPAQIDSFINQLSYSDTLKQAVKYLYMMNDYDPIAFFSWSYTSPGPNQYKVQPYYVTHSIGRRLSKVTTDSGHSALLFYSDYILHIKVLDTMSVVDSNSAFVRKSVGVKATILQTLKGKKTNTCNTPGYYNNSDQNSTAQQEECFEFEYRPELPRFRNIATGRVSKDTLTIESNGSPWIKKNFEYIVFLNYNSLRQSDTTSMYATLRPLNISSTMATMYPIKNGNVLDPYNDFGIGVTISPVTFNNTLLSKINFLLSAQ